MSSSSEKGAEKGTLPIATAPSSQPAKRKGLSTVFLRVLQVVIAVYWASRIANLAARHWVGLRHEYYSNAAPACPQESALSPSTDLWAELAGKQGLYTTSDFSEQATSLLANAIQIKTESFDAMEPVGTDPRWEAFKPFHEYLAKSFPLVHKAAKVTKVNTWGLVYHWQGSDESLKPLLLAAHQDVVPVHPDTVNEWVHPPYSGYFDGSRIWGRGASDDKSGLVGIMIALETLLKPTRSIVVAFGFDEEASGVYGAQELGKYMDEVYGKDGIAMIVDEGNGFSDAFGAIVASPAVGEKGRMDVRVEVTAPGGHSSVPPAHTGIGILSALLVELENNPIPAHIGRATPLYGTLQCYGAHAPGLSRSVKREIRRSLHSDKALHKVEDYFFTQNPRIAAQGGTTTAVDLIGGGVKTNALPELSWAVINHRISTSSSISELTERDTSVFKSVVEKFNMTYTAFGETVRKGSEVVKLKVDDAFHDPLEPAPVSPTAGDEAEAYKLLSGTIKSTYNVHRGVEGDNIVVAPGLSTGNTDTRYYWNLSRNIFRYNHKNGVNATELSGVHTVNENIVLDHLLEMIKFFTTLILNADESTSL